MHIRVYKVWTLTFLLNPKNIHKIKKEPCLKSWYWYTNYKNDQWVTHKNSTSIWMYFPFTEYVPRSKIPSLIWQSILLAAPEIVAAEVAGNIEQQCHSGEDVNIDKNVLKVEEEWSSKSSSDSELVCEHSDGWWLALLAIRGLCWSCMLLLGMLLHKILETTTIFLRRECNDEIMFLN